MRQWVLSFPFQLRFLFASRPAIMGQVLGIVHRVIATHLIKKAGHTHATVCTGAVTLIQRFGSALNLNIHYHMLFLDGVYVDQPDGSARFRWVKAPTTQELTQLAHTIGQRVGRFLERQGLLERDAENSYLTGETVDEDPMTQLLGHSITYRIAVGPQAGRKVFSLQTLPACDPEDQFGDTVGKVAGFSLHAGVVARAHERKSLKTELATVVLPKKGRLSEADREREFSPEFVAARQQHSAVESAINALGVHGLDLCRDHGIEGFKRYVALAVVARNIQRLGAIVRSVAAQKRGPYKKRDPNKRVA